MKVIKKILFDYIYPEKKRCFVCGKNIVLAEVNGLCSDCLNKLEYTSNICQYCGREINITDKEKGLKNNLKENVFLKCKFCGEDKVDDFYFKKSRSVFVYENLGRELIFHFKYFNKKELFLPLGELLYLYYKEYYSKLNIDYVIPIPLYKKRKEERGYNQAKLLANVLAKKSNISIKANALIRDKKTPPLYDLDREKRKALIKGVFSLKEESLPSLKNKNILLVDDIFTTGTTTNEAAFTLKNIAKVNNIYVLTLATARVKVANIV